MTSLFIYSSNLYIYYYFYSLHLYQQNEIITLIINNMKNLKTIEANITKQLGIKDAGDLDFFIKRAKAYIEAINERRVICSIGSVSNSGMSRTIKFMICEKNQYDKGFNYTNTFFLFKKLGYSLAKNSNDYFRINGCGIDMIFHTNYSIIHDLKKLGFITDKECSKLCQMTPSII